MRLSRMREWIRDVVRFPFSLEAIFVAFLFAGRFKGDPRFEWVPVDITAALFGATVLAAFMIQVRQGVRVPRRGLVLTGVMTAFVAWLALTLLWSPSSGYGAQKVAYMATLVLVALFVSAVYIAPSRERIARFLIAILAFGIWTAVETTQEIRSEGLGWFLTTFGADSITLSSTLCLTIAVLTVRILYGGQSLAWRFAWAIVVAWLGILALASGGRGPVVASAMAILIFGGALLVRSLPRRGMATAARRRFVISMALVVAAGIAVAPRFISSGLLTTVARLSVLLTEEGGGESANSRVVMSRLALNQWAESPVLGRGAGSFGVLQDGVDMRAYPHNMFAEVVGESGLIGLGLFSVLLLTGLLLPRREIDFSDEHFAATAIILMFAVLSAQVSGDLSDNRLVFVALGLFVGRRRRATASTAAPTAPAAA